MKILRKLLAILLLALFGLPFVSPLFALRAESETNMPSCCRRHGKHHCLMNMAERSQLMDHGPQFRAPQERCPYRPARVNSSRQLKFSAVPARAVLFAGLVSHPAITAQTKSKWRISRDRSRQKRGPPQITLL